EQITAADTTLTRERDVAVDLEADLARQRAGLTELVGRTAVLEQMASEAAGEFAVVEADCQGQRQTVQAMNELHQGTINRLKRLQLQVQADHAEHLEQTHRAGRLQNEVTNHQANLDNLQRIHDRLRAKGDQAAENLANLDVALQTLTDAEQQLGTRLTSTRESLQDRNQQRERFRQLGEETKTLAAQLREQRSALTSRIAVLDGLERTHEGMAAGVREVFALLEQPERGPWSSVLGMVVEFLTVPHEYAPLIDLALGETAQRFLVRDVEQLIEAIK